MNCYGHKKTGRGGGPDRTGIPKEMKRRFEENSGHPFDDVRVTYNSPLPARLDAAAFTRGTEVYIGPGEERSLPHELGHVIQQKEGRVTVNTRFGGLRGNDDRGLEGEADRLGGSLGRSGGGQVRLRRREDGVIQLDRGGAWSAAQDSVGRRRGNRRGSIDATQGASAYLLTRVRAWFTNTLLPNFHAQFPQVSNVMDYMIYAEALEALRVGNCGEFAAVAYKYLAEHVHRGSAGQWVYLCAMEGVIPGHEPARYDHAFTMLAPQQFTGEFLPAGVDTHSITVIDGWNNYMVEMLDQFCGGANPYSAQLTPHTNIKLVQRIQSGVGPVLTPPMRAFIRTQAEQLMTLVRNTVTPLELAAARATPAFDFPRHNDSVIDLRPADVRLRDMDQAEAAAFLDSRPQDEQAALFQILPPLDQAAYVWHLFTLPQGNHQLCTRLLTTGTHQQGLVVMTGIPHPFRGEYANTLWKGGIEGQTRLWSILRSAPWAAALIAGLPSRPGSAAAPQTQGQADLSRELAQWLAGLPNGPAQPPPGVAPAPPPPRVAPAPPPPRG